MVDAVLHPQADKPGGGENDGIVFAVIQLREAGIHVAP